MATTDRKAIASPPWSILLGLPFLDVVAEIGLASAFPQLRGLYGSAFRASIVVSMSPLLAVAAGWFWGGSVSRRGLNPVFRWAAAGWVASVALLAVTIDLFAAALAARALQGFFSAGFAALPFIAVTRASSSQEIRARLFGRIETAVSAGAILAPISLGLAFSSAPRLSLAGLAVAALLFFGVSLRAGRPAESEAARGRRHRAAERREETRPTRAETAAPPRPETARPSETPPGPQPARPTSSERAPAAASHGGANHVHRLVLLPALFAALVAAQLGALETLIPLLGEQWRGSVAAGKGLTMLFEVAVVIGIVRKGIRPGVHALWTVGIALVLTSAYMLASTPSVAIVLLVAAGFPVGAAVTMGNELAGMRVAGSEEVGMGLYATLRITGSFAGPLFMNIPYPALLLGLIALGVAETGIVLRAPTRTGRGRADGND